MGKQPENVQFLLAEYSALREEIMKRVELEYQVLYLTLSIFAAICAFAIPAKLSLVILLYPILCVFLASAWVNSDLSIFYIAHYIKNHIEAEVGEDATGWEHYLAPKKPLLLSTLSVGGTFIITSLFAIGIGASLAKSDLIDKIFLILSLIGSLYFTILLGWYHRKRRNSKGKPIENEKGDQQHKLTMEVNGSHQ